MKFAVVYFSLEGNTKFAAQRLAQELLADLIPLTPAKKYPMGKFSKYFWAGKSASFREAPKLEAYSFDADKYDAVLLGTPIWASTLAPPLRTFLRANRLAGKKVAFFVSCSGGSADKCFDAIKKEVPGSTVQGTLMLIDPGKGNKPEETRKITDFCAKLKASMEKA